mmetsp:Transcript_2311/g.7570  ORF Transcript_2311/g.7570 Transcript_2311/m.7570 type:complete len:214 (-) Transcript_2311:519-1160(-)
MKRVEAAQHGRGQRARGPPSQQLLGGDVRADVRCIPPYLALHRVEQLIAIRTCHHRDERGARRAVEHVPTSSVAELLALQQPLHLTWAARAACGDGALVHAEEELLSRRQREGVARKVSGRGHLDRALLAHNRVAAVRRGRRVIDVQGHRGSGIRGRGIGAATGGAVGTAGARRGRRVVLEGVGGAAVDRVVEPHAGQHSLAPRPPVVLELER